MDHQPPNTPADVSLTALTTQNTALAPTQSLEQFLRNNPTGCLHIHAPSLTLSEIAWIAQRTMRRPVVLATQALRRPYDADTADWETAAKFANRANARIVDWSKPSDNRTGRDAAGRRTTDDADTPVIFVENGDGNGTDTAVHVASDTLTAATKPSPTPEPDKPGRSLRQRKYEIVAASVASSATAAALLLTTEPVHVPLGIGVLILICAHLFKPGRTPKSKQNQHRQNRTRQGTPLRRQEPNN